MTHCTRKQQGLPKFLPNCPLQVKFALKLRPGRVTQRGTRGASVASSRVRARHVASSRVNLLVPPTGGPSISSTRVRISSPSALSARSRRIEGARQMPSRAAISTGALGLGSAGACHDSRPTAPSSCPLHVEIGRVPSRITFLSCCDCRANWLRGPLVFLVRCSSHTPSQICRLIIEH